MPMPWTYRHASKESDNSAYAAMDGVLQVFRRRLTAQHGIDFASVLPSVPRAVFISSWKLEEPPPPFPDRAALVREVMAVRKDHNLTPENAIEAVAWTLRRYTNRADLERVLGRLPEGAVAFSHVEVTDPREIEQRIF
ncbi:MAG: DUF2267 domain-containing protein [Roseovarius sp.]|uniref:DUF2267 domain-containing protein n=1 Tax=Roseovarius sp. TaxID=1486281 RepID=UPI0032EDA1A1